MRKLILLLFAGCAACSTGAQTGAGAPAGGASTGGASTSAHQSGPQTGQGDTLARLRALAANAACTEDSQCHTLALGTRPCGGPEGYLAWSSAQTRPADIQSLGEQYKAERSAANVASGAMSTCQFLPDPGAQCNAGTCQLLKKGGPAAM
jgi:hypothetical protein